MSKRTTSSDKRVKLGEGAFGAVFLETVRGKQCAVKRFSELRDKDVSHQLLRELSMIQVLHHPNIISLIEVRSDGQDIEMVMPYAGINLRRYTKNTPYMIRITQLPRIAQQILSAVKYLHAAYCIHRDLKPDNILFRDEGDKIHITVCDLGLCKLLTPANENNNSARICTLNYRAPELFTETNFYTQAIDIWSVGALLVELVTGTTLFVGDKEMSVLAAILRIVPTTQALLDFLRLEYIKIDACNTGEYYKLPKLYDFSLTDTVAVKRLHSFQDLVERFLRLDPRLRMEADVALTHEFFAGIPPPPNHPNEVHLSARYSAEPHYFAPRKRAEFVRYFFGYGEWCEDGSMKFPTVIMCIDVFDRYVCAAKPKRANRHVGLICASIIFICSKYVDVNLTEMKDFLQTYSQREMIEIEREILRTLKYQVQHATLLDLYRTLRPDRAPDTRDEMIMADIIYDYDLMRGRSTQELTDLLDARLRSEPLPRGPDKIPLIPALQDKGSSPPLGREPEEGLGKEPRAKTPQGPKLELQTARSAKSTGPSLTASPPVPRTPIQEKEIRVKTTAMVKKSEIRK